MKYRPALAAVLLAGVVSTTSAQDGDVIVALEQACPAGTIRSLPYYRWQDGRFVLVGWVCESVHRGDA